jgi:hypothetical protein
MRTWLAIIGAMAVLLSAWSTFRFGPRKLPLSPARPLTAVVELTANGTRVSVPGRSLVADVATFDDEMFAYLMFGYPRGFVARDGCRAWLTLASSGEMTAPCGVPTFVSDHSPSSLTTRLQPFPDQA